MALHEVEKEKGEFSITEIKSYPYIILHDFESNQDKAKPSKRKLQID